MISIKRKHFHLIINFCLIATLFSDGYTQNVYFKEIRKPVQNGGEDIIKTYLRWCNGNVCLRDHPEYAGPFYSYMKDAKAFIYPTFAILAAHGSEDPWYQVDDPKLTHYLPWYNYTMNGYLSSAWSEIQKSVVYKQAQVKHLAQTFAFAEESPLVDLRYNGWGLNNTSIDPGTDTMIEGWFVAVWRNAWQVVPGQAGIA